jgi:hypothetical protein
MKKTLSITGLICFSLLLSACQLFQNPEDNHKAICKEMKNQMTFSGETANRSLAFQERAEQSKLSQSYHDEGCS